MKNFFSIFSQITIMLMMLILVSSCSSPGQDSTVTMPVAKQVPNQVKNHMLQIIISDKLPLEDSIGGDDYTAKLHFQHIVPWLRSNLSCLNDPGCQLHRPMKLVISISKFYTNIDSNILVSTLILKGQYIIQGKQSTMKTYRAESVSSLFTLTQDAAIQTCFNSALQEIIPKMKDDICQLSSHEEAVLR